MVSFEEANGEKAVKQRCEQGTEDAVSAKEQLRMIGSNQRHGCINV
jgi:hypothetical protein